MARADDARCIYCRRPQDTAEHTLLDCANWDNHRSPVKAFLGGREILPSDIEDLLCGPSHVPWPGEFPNEHKRIMEAATRARNAFYLMVDGILGTKDDDERAREAEARATANGTR